MEYKPEQKTMEDVLRPHIYQHIAGFGSGLSVEGAEAAMAEWEQITNKERDEEIKLLEEREVLWSNKKAQLEDEIERLKGLIEKNYIAGMVENLQNGGHNYKDAVRDAKWSYEKFKTDNNL